MISGCHISRNLDSKKKTYSLDVQSRIISQTHTHTFTQGDRACSIVHVRSVNSPNLPIPEAWPDNCHFRAKNVCFRPGKRVGGEICVCGRSMLPKSAVSGPQKQQQLMIERISTVAVSRTAVVCSDVYGNIATATESAADTHVRKLLDNRNLVCTCPWLSAGVICGITVKKFTSFGFEIFGRVQYWTIMLTRFQNFIDFET